MCLNSYAQEQIIIGLDADLSAVAKEGGIAIQSGAQLAIDELNASGGLLGRQLKLVSKDHKGNPARGISNLKKFAKMPNLAAVLGGVHTPVVLQELKTIHDSNLVFLVPWAAGTPIIKNSFTPNFVFRASIRDEQAAKVLIGYAAKIGAKRVGLVLEKTGWGRSNENSMRKAAKTLGIEVAAVEWINWGISSVDKQLASIDKANVDAIMLVANAPEGVVVSNSLLKHDSLKTMPLISHWGIAGGSFVNSLGLDNLNQMDISTIQTFSFENAYDTKIADKVMNAYRSKFDAKASNSNIKGVVGLAQTYDLVMILAESIKKTQSTDPTKIQAALENLTEHKGLVKHYAPPFTATNHDALLADDYFIARFNKLGELVPR
jgi:branched-chain amino acid transport system substrate-binding protein